MASKFTNFLIKLGEDPQLLEKYQKNPDRTMEEAGLTPAERALLLSGDANLIRSAFVNDPGHKKAMGVPPDQEIQFIWITIVHPIKP